MMSALTPLTHEQFLELCKLAGWKEGDGPLPGVWNNRIAGERCLWSCRWITDYGILTPDVMVPFAAQWALPFIDYEERDYATRFRDFTSVQAARQSGRLRDYPAYWTPKNRGIMALARRDSWPLPEWAVRKPEILGPHV